MNNTSKNFNNLIEKGIINDGHINKICMLPESDNILNKLKVINENLNILTFTESLDILKSNILNTITNENLSKENMISYLQCIDSYCFMKKEKRYKSFFDNLSENLNKIPPKKELGSFAAKVYNAGIDHLQLNDDGNFKNETSIMEQLENKLSTYSNIISFENNDNQKNYFIKFYDVNNKNIDNNWILRIKISNESIKKSNLLNELKVFITDIDKKYRKKYSEIKNYRLSNTISIILLFDLLEYINNSIANNKTMNNINPEEFIKNKDIMPNFNFDLFKPLPCFFAKDNNVLDSFDEKLKEYKNFKFESKIKEKNNLSIKHYTISDRNDDTILKFYIKDIPKCMNSEDLIIHVLAIDKDYLPIIKPVRNEDILLLSELFDLLDKINKNESDVKLVNASTEDIEEFLDSINKKKLEDKYKLNNFVSEFKLKHHTLEFEGKELNNEWQIIVRKEDYIVFAFTLSYTPDLLNDEFLVEINIKPETFHLGFPTTEKFKSDIKFIDYLLYTIEETSLDKLLGRDKK